MKYEVTLHSGKKVVIEAGSVKAAPEGIWFRDTSSTVLPKAFFPKGSVSHFIEIDSAE